MAKKRAKKRKFTRGELQKFERGLGDVQQPFPMWLAASLAVGAALVVFAVSRTAET